MRISDWSSDVCSSDLSRSSSIVSSTRAEMTVCLLIAVMYHLYTNDSRTRLAGPVHQPFVRRQPFESDRPARVEAPRRDADLRPQAELAAVRSEAHTSELQSLMRISYAVFCLKQKTS